MTERAIMLFYGMFRRHRIDRCRDRSAGTDERISQLIEERFQDVPTVHGTNPPKQITYRVVEKPDAWLHRCCKRRMRCFFIEQTWINKDLVRRGFSGVSSVIRGRFYVCAACGQQRGRAASW